MLDTAHTPKSFSLLHSGLTGDKFNTSYAHEVTVTGEADLIEACTHDHVATRFESNIRSNAGFVWSDCVVMDIDNDHTEDEHAWINPKRLAQLMSEVEFELPPISYIKNLS